jgi:acetylornithine/succinyldiaminopimelate/putrescine aminotransferase
MGNEHYKANYRPLLPDCNKIIFNDINSINNITEKTAAVIMETVQGASGFIIASDNFLNILKNKCLETKTLIIFDEIQTGYGRLGSLFGFQQTNIIPDILCIAKGMGGGMPIGAFISSFENMNKLTHNPKLGHITTFGGHPVNCAASFATLNYIIDNNLMSQINAKEELFRKLLTHKKIIKINGKGLMLSIDLVSKKERDNLVENCMKDGLLLFYFLFNENSVRVTPPLTISNEEIKFGCEIILNNLEKL